MLMCLLFEIRLVVTLKWDLREQMSYVKSNSTDLYLLVFPTETSKESIFFLHLSNYKKGEFEGYLSSSRAPPPPLFI